MKSSCAIVSCLLALGVCAARDAAAQSAYPAAPTLIPITGQMVTATGAPRTGTVVLVLSLYDAKDDTAPRWVEYQNVTLGPDGSYNVQFGSTFATGLPPDLFAGNAIVRWVGVGVENEPEQPRVMLVSVPYAAKAASADTLAGKAPSDFVLTAELPNQVRAALRTDRDSEGVTTNAVTLDYLQKGDGVGGTTDSSVYEVGGNVGIGTTSPSAPLDTVANAPAIAVRIRGRAGDSVGVLEFTNNAATAETARMQVDNAGNIVFTNGGTVTERLRINSSGNVGIGTGSPTSKLHVVGNAAFSGNVTVDGNIGAKYQDVAEWVDAAEPLEPGTVVVIDDAEHNRVKASAAGYDLRVAGAVSPQPGVVLGEPGEGRVLVAQSGRVRIKADASHGAIKAGDLLVSSPRKGYAMKSKPVRISNVPIHRPGTVLGKALEPLATGTGEILVLLTLQ